MEVSEIWTEKYRPKFLKEMIGQQEIISRLSAFVSAKSLPHCLFAGPAGCGKTTATLAIASEMYKDHWKNNFLELNASDERGIDTIRVKVKEFARIIPMGGIFKIIYLDEADSLTTDAQHALRRMMEKYSETARFVLSCNYSSKIIPPIQSRTAVFRFSPLKEDDIVSYLSLIAKKEGLKIDSKALKAIVYVGEGDLRKSINILQTAAILKETINEDVIYSVTSKADPNEIKKMINSAITGNFMEARKLLRFLMSERGLSAEDIIKEIHNQIFSLEIPDKRKVMMIAKVGEYEFRLTEGSNPRIQLEALIAQLSVLE